MTKQFKVCERRSFWGTIIRMSSPSKISGAHVRMDGGAERPLTEITRAELSASKPIRKKKPSPDLGPLLKAWDESQWKLFGRPGFNEVNNEIEKLREQVGRGKL